MIKSTLLAALLVSAFAAGAHAQPMMAPKVINYLATLHDVNKSYYGGAVLGVARFSGSGRVEATKDQWGHPDITIDTGSGVVNCSPSSPVDGIKPGDVVTLSGSVGGATTGASIETLDRAWASCLASSEIPCSWSPGPVRSANNEAHYRPRTLRRALGCVRIRPIRR